MDTFSWALAYCIYTHGVDLASKTIAHHLAAISFGAQRIGLPDPCWDFKVRKAVEGWAKATGKCRDARLLVSPAMLQHLVRILPLHAPPHSKP